jgi:HEPN domain-containing protein
MAQEWLKAAVADLQTIEEIINNEHLTHIVAFHSQQCVEKSIKALLEWYEIDIPKIHSVLRLSKIIQEYLIIDDKDMLDELDKLYIDSRYPGDLGLLPNGKPSMTKVRKFYLFAKNIYNAIKKKIGKEGETSTNK